MVGADLRSPFVTRERPRRCFANFFKGFCGFFVLIFFAHPRNHRNSRRSKALLRNMETTPSYNAKDCADAIETTLTLFGFSLLFNFLSLFIFWVPVFLPATLQSYRRGLPWNACMRRHFCGFYGGVVVEWVTPADTTSPRATTEHED